MRTLKVSDVYQLHGNTTENAPEDRPLRDIIKRFAIDPCIRGVFLLDSRGRFSGLITRFMLLDWARVRLGGSAAADLSVGAISRLVLAERARDLARGTADTVGVRPTDDLQTALEHMVNNQVDTIPVLDEGNRVIGDLRLSEVLLAALE